MKHLIYTLAKIDYGRVADTKFKECRDALIESLRKDFPDVLAVTEMQSHEIKIKEKDGIEVNINQSPVLSLLSADKLWAVRISPSFIILHTRNYSNFIDFKEKFLKINSIVKEEIDITHFSFLGMRYLNKIADPKIFESMFERQEFLQPSIGKWVKAGSNITARYVLDSNFITINSGVMIDVPKYSPDLIDIISDLDDVHQIQPGVVAHLDIDSVFVQKEFFEFDLAVIEERLGELRDGANSIFSEIIKD